MDKTYWYARAKVPTSAVTGLVNALGLKIEGYVECPIDRCHVHSDLGPIDLVAHLNDEHNWNFDQIADWVEENEATKSDA